MTATTSTQTLAEFLLARIAEDEQTARAATPGPWRWATYTPAEHYARNALVAATAVVLLPEASDHEGSYIDVSDADAVHIARWDPARALAECEAKRRIVEEVWPDLERDNDALNYEFGATNADPEDVLRLLALPYADHPDYRSEWA